MLRVRAPAFDLADRLQTPIFVMLDLDIGMNHRLCEPFTWDDTPQIRPRQGDDRGGSRRRQGVRPLSRRRRRRHPLPHLSRHPSDARARSSRAARRADRYARYTEEGPDYVDNMQRLLRKFETAKDLVPQPLRRQRRRADALRRDLLRLDQPGDGRGARRARGARASPRPLRVRAFPFQRRGGPTSSPTTTSCSWSSRTATRSCARCWSTNAASIRRGWSRSCTTTARRSPRASSRAIARSPRKASRSDSSDEHAFTLSRRWLHDLPRQAQASTIRRCRRTRSATRAATTRARSPPCAPAAATTRSPPRSSRPAGSSTSSRTASPSSPGIGCSSKTPDYFLGNSHGFNSVHGRMPSVLTGANLANRDLIYLGVSGDGDSASIGLGQFAHAMRRGVNMVYIVENNGVYGLTKGQFSATADQGSEVEARRGQHRRAHRPGVARAAARRHLRRAQLLGRQGAARAAHQGGDRAPRRRASST